jgi:hypothetical protein
MKNRNIAVIRISVVSGLLALAFVAQAVTPAPDGGYPRGNTAEGQNALLSLTSGSYNTAVGFLSLRSNTTGDFNTAMGAGALLANTGDAAVNNTATGAGALLSNTTGQFNTANGAFALFNNSTSTDNTASGVQALFGNTEGSSNVGYGDFTLWSNSLGNNNVAIGYTALRNTTGSGNIGIGTDAGFNLTTGDSNIDIDNQGIAGESNTIRIGSVQTSTFIAGVGGTALGSGTQVLIDSGTGQLGVALSSRRFKKDIQLMDKASEAILTLKPVTFRYKADKTNTPQFGLIAEEVVSVNPDLVVRDKAGKPYTVRYDQVNAMLLNEFLKEHRRVEQLKATTAKQDAVISDLRSRVAKHETIIAQQEKGFECRLSEQQKQIKTLMSGLQRVSAQVETGGPARKVAVNQP